jgi:hypothetical protein
MGGQIVKSFFLGVTFAACAAFALDADARNYYNHNHNHNHTHNHNNSNALTGLVVGTVIGSLLTNTLQPRSTYVYQQPVYVQPVVPHLYYSPPRACNTVRVPVYDAGGRLIEYVQLCAN